MNMPPRWGFSSSGVGGYNDVAPPELKNGSSAAAPKAALIQQQWGQENPTPGARRIPELPNFSSPPEEPGVSQLDDERDD